MKSWDSSELTIIIASYRYGHLAANCIESVLSQTCKPGKIMFLDDGVGDCEHLKDLYKDHDIEWVLRDENMGAAENFHDALMRVKTPKYMLIGADNWISSNTVEALSSVSADMITYDIIITGELKDKWVGYSIHKKDLTRLPSGDYYWKRDHLWHGSIVWDTEKAKSVGGYHKASHVEDKDLWKKMVSAKSTVAHVPQGLLFYRRHSENFIKI